MGTERKLMKASELRKRETLQPISQKVETLLCRLLAVAACMCKKVPIPNFTPVIHLYQCKPQSPLTVHFCVVEKCRTFTSSQALNWYLSETKPAEPKKK